MVIHYLLIIKTQLRHSFSIFQWYHAIKNLYSHCQISELLLKLMAPSFQISICLVFFLLATALMILSLFLRVCGTHHTNAGRLSMLQALEYSVTQIGSDSLRSLNRNQDLVPLSISTQKATPCVVITRRLI